jgi:hypothetical protein
MSYLRAIGWHDVRVYAVTTDAFDFEEVLAVARREPTPLTVTLDINWRSRGGALERLGLLSPTVIVYDDHDAPAGDYVATGPICLRASEGPDRPSVAATYFAYVLWAQVLQENQAAHALVATGLIADRAQGLVADEAWYRSLDLTAVRKLIYLLSAYFARLDFNPQDVAPIDTLRRVVERNLNLRELVGSEDAFVVVAQAARQRLDVLVAREAETLRRRGLDEQQVVVHRFRAPYRVCNLVASAGRNRLPKRTVLVVACQDFPNGTTMAELRLGDGAIDISLPHLLQVVGEQVPFLNFGGHARAAGCRFQSKDYESFVSVLAGAL